METEGNALASRFQVSKRDAVRCLQAAIESFLAAKGLSRDQLAEDLCGMSVGNFSKLSNGVQGDIFAFVFDTVPGDIREDFIERVAELQQVDPFTRAVEQLVNAAFRVVQMGRGYSLPERAERMVKVQERIADKERRRA